MEQSQQVPAANDIFANKTILIMDESAALRQVIGEIFDDLNCQVLTAANRQEVTSHFERNKRNINLILLELDLSFNSGEEMYRYMQTEMPESKVLILSSYSEEEITERFNESIPYLRKPFFMLDLIDRAQTLLMDFPDGHFQSQSPKG